MNHQNPFPSADPNRHYIWNMLVERDIQAFVQADWDMVADDFIEEGFMGIDAGRSSNPDSWNLTFPSLAEYRAEWRKQAIAFQNTEWEEDPADALHRITTLRDIEVNGNSALVHKKFDGVVRKKDGSSDILNWQTLYRCRRVNGVWKIAGFTGYMPNPMGAPSSISRPAKAIPEGASQHKTAGPYSPVLTINPQQIVVISGQAPIDPEGNVVGETIEEQTVYTLDNCMKQLASAGCTARDVFKVNVFLTDLGNWPRFNEVYKTYFPDPKPVRTAVQSGLLYTFLVEIELWAVKK